MAVIWAACLYLLMAFAAGFALGMIRALWIAPGIGETAAVFIELPVMVAVCWFACRAAIGWVRPSARAGPRIAMGAAWFVGLQGLEAVTAMVLRGWSMADWAQSLASPAGVAGLAAMMACAAFPWLQARQSRTPQP
jgi:hypothetical protein